MVLPELLLGWVEEHRDTTDTQRVDNASSWYRVAGRLQTEVRRRVELDSASGVPAAERLEHPRALSLVLQSHARLAQLPSPPLEAELASVVRVCTVAVHASREGNVDGLKAAVRCISTPASTALRHGRRRRASMRQPWNGERAAPRHAWSRKHSRRSDDTQD
eukprot:scaffold81074_cov70-Phaeocystis_antarctica.AAC.6